MGNSSRRPRHATVVAYLALILAVGGGTFAIAAKHSTKINGAKLKKRSVAGSRLKKNTITGTEVNEAKLGKVPTAGTADVANSLATMTALKLTKTTSSASALTLEAAAAAATPVTLYEDSHFKLYGKCFIDETGPFLNARVYIATKQDGAIFDSDDDERNGNPPDGYLNVATVENLREVISDTAGFNEANMQYEGDTEFGATAADGYSIQGVNQVAEKDGAPPTGNGPYGTGNVCLFSGWVLHS